MPAKDLGVKHTCWKCGTKFYDMKKASPACPKCGSDPRAAPVVKPPTAAERRKAVKDEAAEEATDPLEDAAVDEDLAEEPDEPEEAEEDA
jgi:uncharacterized protein (TIGR02300 family)